MRIKRKTCKVYLLLRRKYGPYLPAWLVLVGTIMIGFGLAVSFDPLQAIGSIVSAVGAFWAVHQQIFSEDKNKQLTNKVIKLQDEIHSQITGGASFCYGYPIFGLTTVGTFTWIIIHQGTYPLSDVSVRVFDCDYAEHGQTILEASRSLDLGTLLPGLATTIPLICNNPNKGRYNLFFTAKNGQWTQEIRWILLPNELAVANRVLKHGSSVNEPLILDVSPNYPLQTKNNGHEWI